MAYQKLIFETIEDISRQTSVAPVAALFARAMGQFGFTSLGINSLPPPGAGANPVIVAESTPKGFRDFYIHEALYQIDHICRHARAALEPFRYSEAPYDRTDPRNHRQFLEALDTFGMGKGIIVPVGRPANAPACVWLAGRKPDLHDDAMLAVHLIALFAASKSDALTRPQDGVALSSRLSPREREIVQWISAGKTSWEISVISGLSERAINKIVAEAMTKLDAVTRAQAVVKAIRRGEIEL